MRIIVIISSLILIIWYIITRLEPSNGFVVLDENTISQMGKNVLVQKVLWAIMILLQSFLCYKLYRFIPTMAGMYKTGMQIFFVVVICSLIIAVIIFFIGFTSFWF